MTVPKLSLERKGKPNGARQSRAKALDRAPRGGGGEGDKRKPE